MTIDSAVAADLDTLAGARRMEALIPTGSYEVDPAHTRIGFVARHAMITKVRGSFNEFVGTGFFDADDPRRSSLELEIRADSLDSRNADRDDHVKSSDFLDADVHPTLKFVSTSVEPIGDAGYRVSGDLTVRGVTRSVDIDFEFTGVVNDPDVGLRFGLEGNTVISRKEWGLTWNSPLDSGGVLVGDKVALEVDVSVVSAS